MYHKDFFYKDSSLIGVIAPRGTGKTLLSSINISDTSCMKLQKNIGSGFFRR